MNIRITPGRLRGAMTPPPSKSLSHRALIAAYLAGSVDRIARLADSQDIAATRRCMEALLDVEDGFPTLDCGESGSTLRFLIPLALVMRGGAKFVGRGRLMERPMEPYFDIFRRAGVHFERTGGALFISGALTSGVYELPGHVSSQFVTGLLYALPLLAGDSEIAVTSPLESRDYVTMTVDVLKKYGVSVENQAFQRFFIPGGQKYTPCDYTVEADWSQAAFWYAARFAGGDIALSGLDSASPQGDKTVAALADRLRGRGEVDVDLSQIPDLLPPLAAMAALRAGETTVFSGAARLRMKESDRIASTAAMLRAFGVTCAEGADSLTVTGTDALRSCTVDGANDHRIVMAAAVLATAADGPVTVLGAEAVNKSYPTFFEEFNRLGGIADVL